MFEGIGKDAIEELHQRVLGWLDRLKVIVEELREDTEVEIVIKFRKKANP
jgi:hypothetical protein